VKRTVATLPFRDHLTAKLGTEGPIGELALFVTTDLRALQLDGTSLRNYLTTDGPVDKDYVWGEWNKLTVVEAERENAGLQIADADITNASDLELPDMPVSVLSGTLGRLCQERLARFPLAYAWPALLGAAAPHIASRAEQRTNLYVALVGPVHSGKSVVIDQATRLVASPAISMKAGSAEGLLAFLKDQAGDGVLWLPDELSHTLDKAAISNASFAAHLSTLFYSEKGAITVVKGKVVSYDIRLSLLAGIVDEKFSEGFGSATTLGLYDRFLFGQCPTGFRYRYRPFEGNPAYVPPPVVDGKKRIELVAPAVTESVRMAMDAMAERESLNTRVLEIALRTALISAAFDRVEKLDAENMFQNYLEPAWELARYQERVRKLLQPNEGKTYDGQITHKLLSYLQAHASDHRWIVLRDMLRATHVNNFGSPAVERVIRSLEFSEDIEVAKQKAPGQKSGPGRQLVRLVKVTEKSTGGELGTKPPLK
jgi:hypothetical protein